MQISGVAQGCRIFSIDPCEYETIKKKKYTSSNNKALNLATGLNIKVEYSPTAKEELSNRSNTPCLASMIAVCGGSGTMIKDSQVKYKRLYLR